MENVNKSFQNIGSSHARGGDNDYIDAEDSDEFNLLNP